MKNRRYSDDDSHFWPFTLSKISYTSIGVMLDSGSSDEYKDNCHIRFYGFGYALICELPQIIKEYRIRHTVTSWDEATIARLGRNWYEESFCREYGFTIVDGALHAHYGPQTHDSLTTKNNVWFLPWRSWRYIRHSWFDESGNHFSTVYEKAKPHNSWRADQALMDACPNVMFKIKDYDGEEVIATTRIEEREWYFGTGAFKWLSWFKRPLVRRTLDITFNKEVGPEKGSWKGGTIGTSIDMLPGELHEAAFKRYCDNDHKSKYKQYKVTFVETIKPKHIDPTADGCMAAVKESK